MSNVVIIGGGTMGTIFLEALLRDHQPEDITVLERTAEHAHHIQQTYGVSAVTASTYDCSTAEIVIAAVKPQDSPALATLLGDTARQSLVISMMAGISLAHLRALTQASRIVRCMPNTPARVGMGMTAWTATPLINAYDRLLIEKLLSTFGKILEVASDDWIDKATAISGSGPAYFFAFAEYLIAAAQHLGFSQTDATTLVQTTLAGAAAVWQQSGSSVSDLQAQVTSKGGTTAAAFTVFDHHQLDAIVRDAVEAAYQRAQELAASSH